MDYNEQTGKTHEMKRKHEKEILYSMRGDPKHWKGIFYFNPSDPAIGIPKHQVYRGYTFNFENR